MDKLTVASVQVRMRIPATLEEYRDDMDRFARSAVGKRARLLIFPEMAGLMVGPTQLRDWRTNLLRRAEQGGRRSAGAWQKFSGSAAGWLAGRTHADLTMALWGLLDVDAATVWNLYADIFGGLARTHGVTIIAPSAYMPDEESGQIVNQSAVFGPDGALLGRAAKVLGYSEDDKRVARGRTWEVIQTEVGRLGIVLGSDILFPEVGRLLAYQNAEILVLQAACPGVTFHNKMRSGILARMQDNQLFAVASYVVGESPLRKGADSPYVGKSGLYAPQELTPRFNGVLVEMGSTMAEGVVTAEFDFAALRALWESADTPIRRQMPQEEAATLL
jgi:predicted amidohydrolase